MTKNQECLEAILGHLTKLILLTENGEEKRLEKLVNMSTSVSAQLLAEELKDSPVETIDE